MSKKKLIVWGVIAAVIVGGIFYYRSRVATSTVTTDTVRRGDVAQTVSVTGTLTPTAYADLSFQAVGTVGKISVKEGDAVKSGETIVTLDTSVLGSQLKAAKVAADIAYQSELLAVVNRLKKQEIVAKKLASEQAREGIRTIATQIGKSVITSPIDGVLSKLDLRVGETAVLGKVVAHVVGTGSELLAEAKVPESDITKVSLGMKAKVTFDALSTQDIFQADVIEIDKVADVAQDVVSYVVKFRVGSLDGRLREGMTANVDIETAKVDGALVVPFRVLSKESGKTFIELVRGENRYEKVPVTTGIEGDDGMVEIKSGLSEGDVYVVSKK
jgi:HlyD family secretion protein